MRALDLKLFRDMRRIWAQSLAIALVMACGVMVLVLTNGAQRSLTETQAAYYERNRFADIFATLTRAPNLLLHEIAAIEGVAQAEGRIGFQVVADLDGMAEPATARVISLPASGLPLMNVPLLRAGRMPEPRAADEVVLSEPFAQANDLFPGSRIRAVLNGQLRELVVTGHVLSPEYVYTIGPGTIMPDDRRYGLIWMNVAAAEAARNLGGAFNEVTLRLTRGANEAEVIASLDRLLAPYGGTGAHGRDRQVSHSFLQSELDQLAATSMILPPVFFVVSAFLVNMVLGRLISLERQQNGLLKALGYSTLRIGAHYLAMAVGIGIAGVLIGWAAGQWLGHLTTSLYAQYFRFPWLLYSPGVSAFAVSGVLSILTVVLGAAGSVRASTQLSPAVAMSPPAPPMFRRGAIDWAGRVLHLRQTTMMIARSITRWPGRALVTVFGVSASVAVLVASYFTFDAMQVIVDEAFFLANRQHVTLSLASAQGHDAVADAAALPGVLVAEGGFALPVRLVNGTAERLIALQARTEHATLSRMIDTEGVPVRAPPAGLAMPETLAHELGLAAGDTVVVELLAPPRETWELTVGTLVRQSLGQEVAMDASAMFARMRQAPQVNRIDLLVDADALGALHARIKQAPHVVGVTLWSEVRVSFDETISRSLLTMGLIYTTIGVLITIGVVYNSARIQVSERAHELASLRVMGFTRAEVGFVLVGEVMLLTVAAIPVGWVLGYGFAAATAAGVSTDIVSIPLVVTRSTMALAGAVAFFASLTSVLLVRRRLDRVNLVTALKQRE